MSIISKDSVWLNQILTHISNNDGIPEFVYEMPLEFQYAILQGYIYQNQVKLSPSGYDTEE